MKSTVNRGMMRNLCAAGLGMLLSASAGIAQLDFQGVYNPGSGAASARGGAVHLPDGSTIVVGEAQNINGNTDVYVLHFGPNTCWAPDWQFTYDIGGNDVGRKIRRTADGGYIVVGTTQNTGSACTMRDEIFLMKLNATGGVQWTRTYGGTLAEEGRDVQVVSDGYVVSGITRSWGAGGSDGYIMKTDLNGVPLWGRAYGGTNDDYFLSCEIAANGNIIAAGGTSSGTLGGTDFFLARVQQLNGAPNVGFPTHYGAASNEGAWRAIECANGDLAICGYTRSYGGNAEGFILRTNFAGAILNGRRYGGSNGNGWDEFLDITEMSNTDLMVTGLFFAPTGGLGNYDVYVGRVTAGLIPTGQLVFGGADDDQGWAISRSATGNATGWVVAGLNRSYWAGQTYAYVISRPNMLATGCRDAVPTITDAQVLMPRGQSTYSNTSATSNCARTVTGVEWIDEILYCGGCDLPRVRHQDGDNHGEWRGPGSNLPDSLNRGQHSVASVDDNAELSATFHPNPVRRGGTFTLNLPDGIREITITDMSGRIVYTDEAGAAPPSIDTKEWAPGVYVMRLRNATGIRTQSIVVTD